MDKILEKIEDTIRKEFIYQKDDSATREKIFFRVEQLLIKELIELGYNSYEIDEEIRKLKERGIILNGDIYH